MSTIPPKRNPTPSSISMKDPRWPIWGRLFMCRVARIAHYSTKYLEEYGLHTSGNQNVDREMARQPQLCYISINDMVDLYHQSQTVAIVKQEDVRAIYEICQDYTFDWANRLDKTIFKNQVPFKDLIQLDEFAEAVYQYAGHEYGTEFARSFVPTAVMREVEDLNKMFDKIDDKAKGKHDAIKDTVTVYNQYTPHHITNPETLPAEMMEEKKLPDRPSMRDLFMSYLQGSGR